MGIVHHQQYRQGIRDWIRMKPAYLRWGIYYATILAILVLGVYEKREFIYFQF
jgi:hypothetical protein